MNAPDIGKPLLDYALITEPFPLYAATTDAPPTTLHIVVSNGGGSTVFCREIVFSLPHGDLAQSLVDATSGDGDASAAGWTVTPLQKGVDLVVPEGDYANFVAKAPGDGAQVDASGITITLKNLHISKMPGTARVEVRETATLDAGHWPPSPGFVTLPVTKFPAPLIPVQAVCDFRADKLEVSSGSPVRLTWNGPSTLEYTILHGAGATPAGSQKDTTTDHEWHGTVTRDTAFVLQYVTGGTTHYLSTAVMVDNPTVNGLKIVGDEGLHVTKDAHVDGDLNVGRNAGITGTLAATEDITTHAHFIDPDGRPLRSN
ncbi:hypothetical protein M1P56_19875 [Streptomyces sp. HU2014]|uniref:hypothetical protein n=1 Tax=Streptomyces sp. HU2014 TaxID=2939414 RepID=UPI00200FE7A9|nr:hypothetical protein [Streptomyces sp. HU2014]UQI46443.1 hypothetical protein M1P56_19875 [Streptomyces sp. HU2014]